MYSVCLFSYVLSIHSFCHLVVYSSERIEEPINLKKGGMNGKKLQIKKCSSMFSQKIVKKDVIILF